jgi:two-component system chemotaxis response regulator CheB
VEALHTLLSEFPADCPPTLVVQHINERFTAAVARTLDETCAANVVLAQPDLPLRPGHIYFPPDNDRHLLVGGPQILRTKLRGGDRISGHRPSVDALFQSAADVVGKDAIGILLTGMGADGAKGLLAMARAGALTIAQDEATCAVFGMPGPPSRWAPPASSRRSTRSPGILSARLPDMYHRPLVVSHPQRRTVMQGQAFASDSVDEEFTTVLGSCVSTCLLIRRCAWAA